MRSWLDPVREALDTAPAAVEFFFRDDDVGWYDERLWALLDVFDDSGLPIDLAVIPEALSPSLARRLCAAAGSAPHLRLHQHGFAHVNHEPTGRKHEFGPSRKRSLQRHDIAAGKRRLEEFLGPVVEPIFTPPWNRCTAATADCLVELDFRVLSREWRATSLLVPGLSELPVRVDWFAHRKGVRLTLSELGVLLSHAVDDSAPVGIMFHHAIMDANDRAAARDLLSLLAGHSRALAHSMLALADAEEQHETRSTRSSQPLRAARA